METADVPPPAPRYRQLALMTAPNPLAERLGKAFFRALPAAPGVYFFRDAEDQLLYIGQSKNLRARVGSYRAVTLDRHPRRLTRMVGRVARVEWRPCQTHEEAIALEKSLLLELRPRFNRAGVWEAPPWWFQVRDSDGHLHATLSRKPLEENAIGPLVSSFRVVHAALMRCVFRWFYPETALAQFPFGMHEPGIPLTIKWPMPPRETQTVRWIREFVSGDPSGLLSVLVEKVTPSAEASETERTFWNEQLERLQKFADRPTAYLARDIPAVPVPSRWEDDLIHS